MCISSCRIVFCCQDINCIGQNIKWEDFKWFVPARSFSKLFTAYWRLRGLFAVLQRPFCKHPCRVHDHINIHGITATSTRSNPMISHALPCCFPSVFVAINSANANVYRHKNEVERCNSSVHWFLGDQVFEHIELLKQPKQHKSIFLMPFQFQSLQPHPGPGVQTIWDLVQSRAWCTN